MATTKNNFIKNLENAGLMLLKHFKQLIAYFENNIIVPEASIANIVHCVIFINGPEFQK